MGTGDKQSTTPTGSLDTRENKMQHTHTHTNKQGLAAPCVSLTHNVERENEDSFMGSYLTHVHAAYDVRVQCAYRLSDPEIPQAHLCGNFGVAIIQRRQDGV